MEKLNINQWAEEDRPREKMANLGAEALSDAELLAICNAHETTSGRLQQQPEHARKDVHPRTLQL